MSSEKGKFTAEIGEDVIAEALHSVERHAGPAVPELPEAPPPSDDIAEVRSQLELSQAKGRELLEKLRDEHERTLRAAADLDNYRKRALKEKDEVARFGIERLLKDFLPVVDNLDRAVEHGQRSGDWASLEQGLQMTRRQFEDALGKHGVRAFVSLGEPFDPRIHEAMGQQPSAEVPAGVVLSEVLRGYTLHDRLVRPALVTVSTGTGEVVDGAAPAPDSDTGAPIA